MIQHQCQELEPLLSGYLDGELTAGDRQRVELILDDCETCSRAFTELQKLRQGIGGIEYEKMSDQEKQELSQGADASVGASLGQILFFVGVITVYGTGLFYILRGLISDSDAPMFVRLGVPAILLGIGILFFTVLFQRMKAAKTDKYKNVRI